MSRKIKCSENTPACGATDAALAVAVMIKSMSPVRIFSSITGSWPSCAPYFFDGGPGKRVLKSSGPDTDHIAQFTASAEGKRLMKAFARIDDRELRRHIAQLVTMLAE